jgi:amino acid adenylation domain-containing protein
MERRGVDLSSPSKHISILSAEKRELFAMLLKEQGVEVSPPQSIPRRTLSSPASASFAQQRLWFLDQLAPGTSVYNVPNTLRLSGALDVATLEQSLNEIVRRHEVLRTTFATVEGEPVQVIAEERNITIPVLDLTQLSDTEREVRAHRLANDETQQPFDLTQGPLVRASLIRLTEEDHIFLLTMHHIISDGWSLVLFFQELATLYEAFSRGEPSPLNPLPIQYADYAAWQRAWLQGEVLEKQLAYWRKQLGGILPVLELATDRPRPAVQTYDGARSTLILSEQLTEDLTALSQREGVTLFMTLLAAFKALLYRYTGQEDIIVGSPIANRPQTETEELIGLFLNNLALRTDLSGDPSFREILARVRRTALEAYAHQDVPFEKLIEELNPERDLSRTPLFQVYFNLFNFADEIKLPGSGARTASFNDAWFNTDENLSKFDLTLYGSVENKELKLAFVYNVDLFDEASIARMLDHFQTLLKLVVVTPDRPISDFALRTEAETYQESIRSHSIRPVNPFSRFEREEIEQSIADRFEAQVREYPTKIAVKSRNHEWSYEELNRAANQIAHSILSLQGAEEQIIALLFEHDAPMVAALFGALKAGKTYVPLDPSYPAERLAYILQHSQAGALVTNNKNLALARELAANALTLINIDSLDSATPAANIDLSRDPTRLAYILYTSGSTGQPKGVMQNHRNVLHYIRVYTNNLHLNSDDRLTLLSSYCFDASVMDIYGALLNGATLYPIDLRQDGLANLAGLLSTENITIYHSTPTVYRYFVSTLSEGKAFPEVRFVVLGGEAVNRRDVELYKQHFADQCLFVNGLGPTEATVSLQYFVNRQTEISGQAVPVGYPVEDTEILLLNAAGKPAEIYGEIAIRSEHVALGYWRDEEATTAAFIAEEQGASKRTYRTGDMGRRLPDGSIEFEGRKDAQVKIRGFRVELGDIESALSEHPSVSENAVVASEDKLGEKRLVAYIVPHAGHSDGVNDLRGFLKQKLPDYMVPTAFVLRDSLPLTSSGKVNRRALPAPDNFDYEKKAKSAAPQTQLEQLLAGIWAELLGVKQVGINDNFFELGGHSLKAMQVMARVNSVFQIDLPLLMLFEAGDVATLSSMIEERLIRELEEMPEDEAARLFDLSATQ